MMVGTKGLTLPDIKGLCVYSSVQIRYVYCQDVLQGVDVLVSCNKGNKELLK
jgi:hypothetical protein